MSFGLRTDRDGDTFVITLERPESRNALTCEVMEGITAALRESSESTAAVVLTGQGSVFCSGIDLRELAEPGGQERCLEALVQLIQQMSSTPAVVVCRINGDAYGAGMALIGCSDISVAVEAAFFGFPEVKKGMVATIAAETCAARLGAVAASTYLLTGRRFTAAEAVKLGFITAVSAAATLDDALSGYLGDLIAADRAALRATKQLLRELAP